MKSLKFLASALAVTALFVFTGCDDDDEPETEQVGTSTPVSIDYSVAEICNLYDGDELCLPSAYVVAIASGGYIVSDDFSTFIYVSDYSFPALGDEVSVTGQKSSNSYHFPVIRADSHEVISSGNAISYPSAVEISGKTMESYTSPSWEYVCVTGKLDGTTVTTAYTADYDVTIVDTPEIGLGNYNDSKVVLYGFSAGIDKKSVRLIATSVEGQGNVTNFFFDDLEWIAPYAEATGAGDNVATGISTTNAPSVSNSSGFMSEFEERGYEFVNSTSTLAAYLQTNYLKLGATNGVAHTGIKLPVLDVADGTDIVLQFDWCPMRGGGLWFDRVQVDVLVGDENVARYWHTLIDSVGDNEGGTPLTWITETLVIEDYSPSDRIVLRSYPWDVEDTSSYPSGNGSADYNYLRYFLDNFVVYDAY